jgi:hypothetical protein
MAHLRLEISDFAELLRDAVNSSQPLFEDTFSYLKGNFEVQLIAHRLEALRIEGAIVVTVDVGAKRDFVFVNVQIPKLFSEIPFTLKGGSFLIRDGQRKLEIDIDGGVTADVRLSEVDNSHTQLESVDITLRGFTIRFHMLPAWIERKLRRPIERAIELALERAVRKGVMTAVNNHQLPIHRIPPSADTLDGQVAPRPSLTSNLKAPSFKTSELAPTVLETSIDVGRGPLARYAYSVAYYSSFGVVFPAVWMASWIPSARWIPGESSAVRGLRDGAATARIDVRSYRYKSTQP